MQFAIPHRVIIRNKNPIPFMINQFRQPFMINQFRQPFMFNQFGQPFIFNQPKKQLRKICRVPGCNYCQPGKPHYCRNCGSRDSDHFKTNCPKLKKRNNSGKKDLKNSAIVIIKNNKILLLKDYRGYWVTPGGGRHRGETPWDTAKREYEEETGNNDLPNYYKRERFDFLRYNTNIYVCRTNESVKYSPNNETYKAKWVSISDIVNDKHNRLNIRNSNKATLMSLYKMGEL